MMAERSFSQEKNFKEYFDRMMKWEGGYSNNSNDPGGETIYGITKKNHPEVFNKVITAIRNRQDPWPIVMDFYYKEYWLPYAKFFTDYKYDPILFEIMEIAMNMGKNMAIRIVQISCNIFDQECKVDSIFGEKTAKACMLAYNKYGEPFINCINVLQGMRYFTLALKNDNLYTFLRGWMGRT